MDPTLNKAIIERLAQRVKEKEAKTATEALREKWYGRPFKYREVDDIIDTGTYGIYVEPSVGCDHEWFCDYQSMFSPELNKFSCKKCGLKKEEL